MQTLRNIIYLTIVFSLLPQLSIAAQIETQTCPPVAFRNTPTERFTNHGDGTVTDKETGLMWQHCLDGLSGDDCLSGEAIEYSWTAALQRAEMLNSSTGIANYVDWRVPNIKELLSIVERGCISLSSLTINTEVFPNSQTGDFHAEWSSTPYLETGPFTYSSAYVLRFSHGAPGPLYKIAGTGLRLVRTINPAPAN